MAGEWIPMRIWLSRDPKAIAIADCLAEDRSFMDWLSAPFANRCCESAYERVTCDVMRHVTVASLMLIWGVANERGHIVGDDLLLTHSSLKTLDRIAGIPGIGEAMAFVGWAVEEEIQADVFQVRFPNFLQLNVPARMRDRTGAAERSKRYRSKKKRDASVTGGVTRARDDGVTRHVTDRDERHATEKNRTEGSEDPLTPFQGEARSVDRPAESPAQPAAPGSVSVEDLLAAWNAVPHFARCACFNDARKRQLTARLGEPFFVAHWRAAIDHAARKPFCRGDNDRGWKATIDWFLRPATVVKLLEGQYGPEDNQARAPLPPSEEEKRAAAAMRRLKEENAARDARAVPPPPGIFSNANCGGKAAPPIHEEEPQETEPPF